MDSAVKVVGDSRVISDRTRLQTVLWKNHFWENDISFNTE